MRKKKQPRAYAAVTRRSLRPEITVCLTCHTPLRRYATLSQRTVITLDGPVRVIHRGYRCPNAACATRQRSYRSAHDMRNEFAEMFQPALRVARSAQ